MITQQQKEKGVLVKKEFYAEINPIKLDISGNKADILGLKIDVSTLKSGMSDIKKEILIGRKEAKEEFSNVRKEMSEMKEDLITAMCQQTQRLVDLIDFNFKEKTEYSRGALK